MIKVALIIAAIVFVAGCVGQNLVSLTVSSGDVVSVYYTLKVDGSVVDSNIGGKVFTFTVGSGQVIPGFDKGVIGMSAGEEKTFSVSPKDGYGETGSHPLAGKTLVFTVRLVDLKKA